MLLGYACLNETIKSKFFTCRLSTFQNQGNEKIKELTLKNLKVVYDTLRWNIENNIYFYRSTSGIVPLATHKEMKWQWDNDEEVNDICLLIKNLVDKNNLRLTTHPGQYSVLNTPYESKLINCISDFVYHSKFACMTGGSDMITHTGGAYGDKEESKKRFANNYDLLPSEIKKYLRLENDDKIFTIDDVLDIHQMCGIPIVLDIHHHNCNPGRHNIRELIPHIVQTWNGVNKPKMHISSGRKERTDSSHHDYVSKEDYLEFIDILDGNDVDIMFESKKKEKSILILREEGIL
jgi:UV damage endonuclease UvdE